VLFWIFGPAALLSAVGVIRGKNPIYSAFWLIACFFFLAGIYVLLAAHLIAVLQILVYAGAVMVLFVFVIMMLNLRDEELGRARVTGMKILGVVAVAAIAALLLRAAFPAPAPPLPGQQIVVMKSGLEPTADLAVNNGYGTVKEVGRYLFNEQVLGFEAVSLLLLVAIVGAVVVAKGKL
jgi:NADH-quinone oxidoreductase subunit J